MTEVALQALPDVPAAPRAVDLERPLVICGVGRSGTSLLQSMLAAHPEVCFPPETHFFRRYVADRRERLRWEALGPLAFVAHLAEDEDFARAGVDVDELLLPESGRRLDLLRTYRRFLRTVAERAGASRVGDKDPRNLDHLWALRASFPDARVLHVYRDPRDVLLSRTRAAWSACRPWWAHAFVCEEQLRRGRALGRLVFGSRWHEVRYEELIADPEGCLRRVCAAARLDFDPAMLSFSEAARGLVQAEELSWKKETLGPLLSGNAGKWREGLRPAQVALVEAVAREAFDALGYERSGLGPRRAARALATLTRPLVRAAYALRLRYGGARG